MKILVAAGAVAALLGGASPVPSTSYSVSSWYDCDLDEASAFGGGFTANTSYQVTLEVWDVQADGSRPDAVDYTATLTTDAGGWWRFVQKHPNVWGFHIGTQATVKNAAGATIATGDVDNVQCSIW